MDQRGIQVEPGIKNPRVQSTLSEAATLGARQSSRLREVIAYEKNDENKPNAY